MNKKTEELRDIFIDVTEGETVTEKQEAARGSLSEDRGRIEARIDELVARMREQFEFRTDLADDDLLTVIYGFFDGESDAALAERLDADRETVVRARHDLHLLRERETDAPFELQRLRELLNEDRPVTEVAAELDVAESTVRKYRAVVETQTRRRSVNDRFHSEFEELLTDADLAGHTEEVQEDGLDEATDGMETDVSF
ncbi:conditioned medium-induced protein 4 [Halomarina ordinaria]|uniref:Conditioned medium-induced protein 4 n=1 Tax=Halomarina ordinaria TaxID=3033939 RepID=A0ABD5U9U0_9EURY|nr:conditioned medium-induced protein 4 [Halomarina sp. PSRA2]